MVDEQAWIDSLRSGHLAVRRCDVLSVEPSLRQSACGGTDILPILCRMEPGIQSHGKDVLR